LPPSSLSITAIYSAEIRGKISIIPTIRRIVVGVEKPASGSFEVVVVIDGEGDTVGDTDRDGDGDIVFVGKWVTVGVMVLFDLGVEVANGILLGTTVIWIAILVGLTEGISDTMGDGDR